jgi:muconolactone D-isomerase
MSMFLVHMELKLPPNLTPAQEHVLYKSEAKMAKPYLDSGEFARVWREPATRNHWALWDVPDVEVIHRAYTSFPMYPWMTVTVHPLCVNTNDPREPARDLPGIKMTYGALRYLLDDAKAHGKNNGLEDGLMLSPTVSIHDHPNADRGRQLHFMVNDGSGWQKIAELGPALDEGEKGVGPGYVDFIAEWQGRPVLHQKWKARIMEDNRLLHPDYQTALNAPRARY